MAKFALVDGDAMVLTSVFNALRAGMGTYLQPTASLEGFLNAWKDSTSAFASEAGFIGLSLDAHASGSASVVLCQFQTGAVDAALGEQFAKLSRELLKGFDLVVIRAAAMTDEADRLLMLAGFLRDGLLRKLVPDADGVLQDLSMYSLTRDDLLHEVTQGNGAAVEHRVSQPEELVLSEG